MRSSFTKWSGSRLTPEEFSARYDLELGLVRRAMANITSERSLLLGVSGRIASGKDTAAPLIAKELGYDEISHESFATSLKQEVTHIIELIREATPVGGYPNAQLVLRVADELACSEAEARFMVRTLWCDVRSGAILDARTREKSVRTALQYWGTEVRRTSDPLYWVKRSMAYAVEVLADGGSIMITDARFENEVDSLLELGGVVVRLRVSPEEQRRRLILRDGLILSPEALPHSSETSLDSYEESGMFTTVIDSDESTIGEVVSLAVRKIKDRDPLLKVAPFAKVTYERGRALERNALRSRAFAS